MRVRARVQAGVPARAVGVSMAARARSVHLPELVILAVLVELLVDAAEGPLTRSRDDAHQAAHLRARKRERVRERLRERLRVRVGLVEGGRR